MLTENIYIVNQYFEPLQPLRARLGTQNQLKSLSQSVACFFFM